MDNYKDWDKRVGNLLKFGSQIGPVQNIIIDEDNAKEAINLLTYIAISQPSYLLRSIIAAPNGNMIMIALAILMSAAPNQYLNQKTIKFDIFEVLFHCEPDQLIEFIEYLKSKAFGRGFGSRPQKLIRKAIEAWSDASLRKYINIYPKSIYSLVKLVHPRLDGVKGLMIKELVNRNK